MASTTAEYMALFRALESVRQPCAARLFQDPFALGFMAGPLRAAVTAARVPLLGCFVPWFIDRRWPGARPSGVARTRWIDDELRIAIGDGARQVLILGAGFDARALRIQELEHVRVFEVDEPSTSRAKRERLREQLGALPSHVTHLEVDFNRDDLEHTLQTGGLNHAVQTFVIWEGVTNYLDPAAVDATLRCVARSCAPGSGLLFTYVHRGLLDGSAGFGSTGALDGTLRRASEPWTFGLEPSEVREYLAARGLSLVRDVGSTEYRARYLGARGSHLKGYEFYRGALAEVAPRAAEA